MTQRWRLRLGRAAGALGLFLVFLSASTAGLLLHLDLPPGRRFVGGTLTRFLNQTFRGRFEINGVERLTLTTLRVAEAHVYDPSDRRVLSVFGLRVRADALSLGAEALASGKQTFEVRHVRAERVEVQIEPDPKDGEPTIAAAFSLRKPPAPRPPSAPRPEFRVWFPEVEVGRGRARGRLAGTPKAEGVVSGVRGSVLVTPDGVAVDAPRFSTRLRGAGAGEVRGVASFHQRGTHSFFGSFNGYVGDLQVDSVARLDRSRLDLKLDLPEARPEGVRAYLPDWPIERPVSVHLEAVGEIPNFATKLRVVSGASEAEASGQVTLGVHPRVQLTVAGRALDLTLVAPDAPGTSFDVLGELRLESEAKGTVVDFSGRIPATAVAGVAVPDVDFTGRYHAPGLEGRATLHEPGMPTELAFAVARDGTVTLDARARRFRFERVERLRETLDARALTDLRLQARIAEGRFEATLTADAEGFRYGEVGLAQGSLKASGNGKLAEPEKLLLDAQASGRGFTAGAFHFDTATANVSGPLARLELKTTLTNSDGPSIVASTKLSALRGSELEDVDLQIRRNEASVVVRAARIDLARGNVEAKDVRIEGAGGTLTGSGRYRPGLFELAAKGSGIELGKVGGVLGLSRSALAGRLDVDVDLVAATDVRRGNVRIRLDEGAVGPIGGVSAAIDATLDGDTFNGELTSSVKGYGDWRAEWELESIGDPFDGELVERLAGRLDVGIERLELSHLARLLPEELGVAEVRGEALGQVTLFREQSGGLPSVRFLAGTRGLGLSLEPKEPGAEKTEISRLELHASGTINGGTGSTELSVQLFDEYGTLASASGQSELDWRALLADPGALAGQLRKRELRLTAIIDGRSIEELPELIRPKDIKGTLRLEAALRGTLEEPILSAKAALGAVTLGKGLQAEPFDACVRGQYDPSSHRFGVGGEIYIDQPELAPCAGKRVALASAAGTVDLEAARAGLQAFRGDAQLSLEDLPLEYLTPLGRAQIAGRARGRAALVHTGELPQLSARFELEGVSARELAVGDGSVELRSNGRDLRADVNLVRASGHLTGQARAALDWSGLVPALDRESPLALTASVRNIDAAVLEPLLDDVLSDLSGRLDGNLKVALVPAKSAAGADEWKGDVAGRLTLENGELQLAGLGMRLSAVRFEADAKKVGSRTRIEVRRLSAASSAKHANVAASADLYLRGLDFTSARANVNLSDVPLMIEGTSQAELTGNASVALERLPDKMKVTIDVPRLDANLPASSGRDVLSTDAHPDIVILQPIAEPTRAERGDSLPWELTLRLGRDVALKRGPMFIPLRGEPVLLLADTVDVRGDLDLEPGGRVTLLGKVFVIEQGEVHFDTGEPGNPHLRVLASWRAPDATVVYVEVSGTYRDATLRLSSNPSRSEAEIQALLMGGAGIGTDAGVLNNLLADTSLPHVELRTAAETGDDDNRYQSYTAAVQLSDEVWFETTYKNPSSADATEGSDGSLSGTIDWRFRRDWSLRTEVGNIGYGLDLLWQYRY